MIDPYPRGLVFYDEACRHLLDETLDASHPFGPMSEPNEQCVGDILELLRKAQTADYFRRVTDIENMRQHFQPLESSSRFRVFAEQLEADLAVDN